MKSNPLLRPRWHQWSGRVPAQVFVCVLVYALWKALDHLLHQAGLVTCIRKPDLRRPNAKQPELLAALTLTLPERLCADRDVTDIQELGLPTERAPLKR